MPTYRFITTSDHCNYHKKWNQMDANSVKSLINFLVDTLIRVYDADTCGSTDFYIRLFELDSAKILCEHQFYKISYSWYIDYTPEWELIDKMFYKKINKNSIPSYKRELLFSDRDWLILS